MTHESEERKRKARERLNPDDPLRGLTEDEHEAARRRLERRLASRGGASDESDGALRTPSAKDGGPRRVTVTDEGPHASHRASEGNAPASKECGGSLDGSRLILPGVERSFRLPRLERVSAFAKGVVSLPRPIVIGAGVVVLVLLFAIVGAIERSCAVSGADAELAAEQQAEQGQQEQSEPATEQADLSKLPAGIDSSLADTIANLAAGDERVAHIVNTIGTALSVEGESEQIKMLKLVANDPQAIDFVAGLADNYPAQAGQPYDDAVEKGTIPLLMQWDARWGYTQYCGSSFGSAGCCPTSLSMVYMGLTGKTDMTPYDMGQLAVEGGYAMDGKGTIGSFLVDKAPELGLVCEWFYPDAGVQALATYLESGYVVICNVGPGDFTESGHFFVITGMDDEGRLTINDPYSSVRSAQTWDAYTILNQTIALYAFKTA